MEILKSFGITILALTVFTILSAAITKTIDWLVNNMSVEVALWMGMVAVVVFLTAIVHIGRMSEKKL
jgi:hypothetical protein